MDSNSQLRILSVCSTTSIASTVSNFKHLALGAENFANVPWILFHRCTAQGRRKVWKSEGASSNLVGIICPPGELGRLTGLPKSWGPQTPRLRQFCELFATVKWRAAGCKFFSKSFKNDRFFSHVILLLLEHSKYEYTFVVPFCFE